MEQTKDWTLIWGALWIVIGIFSAKAAFGQNVRLGEPVAVGSGCPKGTISAALSPDQSAVSVLFDSFILERAKGSTRSVTSKCQFVIPVSIDRGWKVGVANITYRGFVSVPPKAHALLITENIFRHPRTGPPMTKQTVLGSSKASLEQDYLVQHASLQTFDNECRSENNIKFNTILSLNYSNGRFIAAMPADAVVTIDSLDISNGSPIEIGLDILRCK